jgi:hypothetical protein
MTQSVDASRRSVSPGFARRFAGTLRFSLLAFCVLVFSVGLTPSWFGLYDTPGLGRGQVLLIGAGLVGAGLLLVFGQAVQAWVEARAAQLLLLATVCVLMVAGGELVCRAIPHGRVNVLERMFISEQPFCELENGATIYHPNRRIREVHVAGEGLEFDVVYAINGAGCVDQIEYEASSAPRRIALVGDSFTAGYHGGRPWIEDLRAQLDPREYSLYNLGVAGTSLENFALRLDAMRPKIDFNEIWICCLTTDVERERWTGAVEEGFVVFRHAEGSGRVWRLIDFDESHEAMVAWAYDRRFGPQLGRMVRVARRSRLVEMCLFGLRSTKHSGAGRAELADKCQAILSGIRDEFPEYPLHFVQIPENGEVAQSYYRVDLRPSAEASGFRYHDALMGVGWTLEDFHTWDAHPTQEGYGKLAAFLATSIEAGGKR